MGDVADVRVSEDRQRAVSRELLGVACYRLIEGSHYRHDGMVRPEDAEAYLAGADVPRIVVWQEYETRTGEPVGDAWTEPAPDDRS
jgi:hypothetical protein